MDPLTISLLMYGGSLLLGAGIETLNEINETSTLDDDIKNEKDRLDAQWKDELADLTLKNTISERDKELENQQTLEKLESIKDQSIKDINLDYDLSKRIMEHEAENMDRNADLMDISGNFAENQIGSDFNSQVGMLALNQLMNGVSDNAALMQIGTQEGNSLAAMAGNGTRAGGTIGAAVELQGAVSEMQMQMQQQAQRQGDNLGINSSLNNIRSAMFDVKQNRDQADFTRSEANYNRAQYAEGGIQYTKLQNDLGNINTNYANDVRHQNELYNQQMQDLKDKFTLDKTNLENYYTRAKGNLDNQKEKWEKNRVNRFLTNTFKIGSSINNTGVGIVQASKYF